MSGAETARRRVVQRRIGSAEMALPLKLWTLNFDFEKFIIDLFIQYVIDLTKQNV